jgi:hypothetical protein
MHSFFLRCSIGLFFFTFFGCITVPQTSGTVLHLERCTNWDYREDRFGTTNRCKEPVTIQFMLISNQRIEQREVKPGEVFDTGLSRMVVEDGWLFTTCPVGYSPSVPFLLENKDLLLPSQYDCVKK